jgi:hypothetical protein
VKRTLIIITIFTIIFSIIVIPAYVEASEGLPGSAKFGYGARLDVDGEYLDKVISTASYIGLDWVAVEFDWAEMWPDPSSPPRINVLSEVINQASQNGLSVLLTISNPASWAVTERGPDPQTTANLTLALVDFFSGKILAVELYPGSNTKNSWIADPHAGYYFEVLKRTQETLSAAGKQIALITTVTPESSIPSANDINDLVFLSDLYASGGKPYLTIVGIKFNKITGAPFSDPGSYFLRHYEEIRSVMLANSHNNGSIWITGFKLPVNDNLSAAQNYPPPVTIDEQSTWIEQAYKLMRAQLYIGAAFFDQVNPSVYSQDQTKVTIIENNSNIHPMADRIKQLIIGLTPEAQLSNQNNNGQDQGIPQTANNNTFLSILLKKYVRQIDFKHH